MLNPAMPLYECDNLARFCMRRGVLDEDTAMKLKKVPIVTSLSGLAPAIKASESIMINLTTESNDNSLGNKQFDALQHISEVWAV